MNKSIITPPVITALATFIICLCINISMNNESGIIRMMGIAIAIVVETVVLAIVGLIFSLYEHLRPIGQGLLIGLGLNLVIGFCVCTIH